MSSTVRTMGATPKICSGARSAIAVILGRIVNCFLGQWRTGGASFLCVKRPTGQGLTFVRESNFPCVAFSKLEALGQHRPLPTSLFYFIGIMVLSPGEYWKTIAMSLQCIMREIGAKEGKRLLDCYKNLIVWYLGGAPSRKSSKSVQTFLSSVADRQTKCGDIKSK